MKRHVRCQWQMEWRCVGLFGTTRPVQWPLAAQQPAGFYHGVRIGRGDGRWMNVRTRASVHYGFSLLITMCRECCPVCGVSERRIYLHTNAPQKKKMKKRTCTCVRSCALSLDLLISMDLWDVVLCGWAQPAQNRAAVEEWGARIKSYRKIVLASDWLEFHIYKYVAAYVCMSVRYVHGRRAIRGNVQI